MIYSPSSLVNLRPRQKSVLFWKKHYLFTQTEPLLLDEVSRLRKEQNSNLV